MYDLRMKIGLHQLSIVAALTLAGCATTASNVENNVFVTEDGILEIERVQTDQRQFGSLRPVSPDRRVGVVTVIIRKNGDALQTFDSGRLRVFLVDPDDTTRESEEVISAYIRRGDQVVQRGAEQLPLGPGEFRRRYAFQMNRGLVPVALAYGDTVHALIPSSSDLWPLYQHFASRSTRAGSVGGAFSADVLLFVRTVLEPVGDARGETIRLVSKDSIIELSPGLAYRTLEVDGETVVAVGRWTAVVQLNGEPPELQLLQLRSLDDLSRDEFMAMNERPNAISYTVVGNTETEVWLDTERWQNPVKFEIVR